MEEKQSAMGAQCGEQLIPNKEGGKVTKKFHKEHGSQFSLKTSDMCETVGMKVQVCPFSRDELRQRDMDASSKHFTYCIEITCSWVCLSHHILNF